jgi:hypothetical protein
MNPQAGLVLAEMTEAHISSVQPCFWLLWASEQARLNEFRCAWSGARAGRQE